MSGKTVAVLTACLAAAGFLLTRPVGPGLALDQLLVLLAGGVVLELSAPKLGVFGFFSAAPAVWLGLALQPGPASRAAVLVALLALAARTLTRGHSRFALAEMVADLAPLAAGLLAARLAPHPFAVAPVVWLLFWVTAPGLVSDGLESDLAGEWGRFRSALLPQQAGVAGGIWLLSQTPNPVTQVVLCIVMAGLAASASAVTRAVEAQTRQIAQRDKERVLEHKQVGLARIEESLVQAGQAQQRSEADLQVRLETYTLVDKMLESVTGRPALTEVAKAVLERVRRKVPCQSVVLFWRTEQGLVSLASATPYQDRLQVSSLLRAQEPVVARCLKLQRSERMLPSDSEVERIFPEELSTLAVPMQDRGALYLGHPTPLEVSEEQNHFLRVLANHAVLALEAAEFHQAQQTALQREAAAASRNEALVQRLAQVITGVTELVKVQQPQEMLDLTGKIVEGIVPHDIRYLFGSGVVSQQGPGSELLLSMAETVQKNGKPLLIDYMSKSRFLPPVPEATSALAVPIVTDRGCLGAVVVARTGGEPFQREDQDVLAVLTYQLGAALLAAELYSRLQVAHVKLKESQAQLVQSSKLAAIGQLAGGVAHELNTPLGAIALAVDGALVTLRTKPERAESRLQRACSSVAQMKQIVSKLLFYSRDARSGRRETDLNQVIMDAVQLIAHQMSIDNVEVVTELAPVSTFLANQNELQQVFTNLCLNARDAVLSEGASQKRVEIRSEQAGEELKVRVRDYGCGMSDEVKERIFEPFYTTKEVGKGTGLGLSVTIELVQQHGGRIDVQSAPGQGTEFCVTLPLEGPPEEES